MKHFITALVLMALIVVYSVIASICLNNWQKDVTDIIDDIRLCNENNDSGGASAAADELTDVWVKIEKKMSLFVLEDKLSAVSSSIAKVPQFVTEANDELDAELESIRRQLELIYHGELPLWYNLL